MKVHAGETLESADGFQTRDPRHPGNFSKPAIISLPKWAGGVFICSLVSCRTDSEEVAKQCVIAWRC